MPSTKPCTIVLYERYGFLGARRDKYPERPTDEIAQDFDYGEYESGKDYYVRIKLVVDNPQAELPINYFEIVPKSIYAGVEAEDTH